MIILSDMLLPMPSVMMMAMSSVIPSKITPNMPSDWLSSAMMFAVSAHHVVCHAVTMIVVIISTDMHCDVCYAIYNADGHL